MKILVPTDFSENAKHALQFAIDLLQGTNGSIYLYHVYQIPRATGSFGSMENYIVKDAQTNMEQLLAEIKPNLKGVTLDSKIVEGRTVKLVSEVAEKRDFDLIIMGTKGASGLREVFVGSIASAVMEESITPVLAIPASREFRGLKKIVFAVDEEPLKDKNLLKLLKQLQAIFQSKLEIVHVRQEFGAQNISSETKNLLSDLKFEITYLPPTEDVAGSVQQFAKDQDASLLCMVRRKRGFFSALLHPSVTRQEIMKVEVPLLILHEQ